MIVLDSSAIVAILTREPTREVLISRIIEEDACLISAANYVETGQALALKSPRSIGRAIEDFHAFLQDTATVIEPIDQIQARVALEARRRYGRGFGHPAGLNYSDCFAYALAKVRKLPLLYVGDAFTHTDIVSALA